jgi:hypothetical protein
MNQEQMSHWIAERFGDRIYRPTSGGRSHWRLDGETSSAAKIWDALVRPCIVSGEIGISFEPTPGNVYLSFSKVNFAKYADQ